MREWQRITATEYAKPAPLAEHIASKVEISIDNARELLRRAGERVRRILGLDAAPIAFVGDKVQFQNFAGLLVLARGLELEVVPKFLGNIEGWREDFFLLATLSHHGRLLDTEGLQAAAQVNSDLGTLIGRSMVEMYWRNHRRPLRTYRRVSRAEFAIEGDYAPEDLIIPTNDGFVQELTSFTRINSYNRVIRAAAARLAPVVPDAETRARLERVAEHLPRQRAPTRLDRRRVPSRAQSWQPTYDLSIDILRGLGGAYDPKNAVAPGFVMTTWQVWEHLISIALRSAVGGKNITIQPGHRLGIRTKGTAKSPVTVFPDAIASVSESTSVRKVIIDAKYKGHVERRGAQSVSNADIYEALAFSRATAINDVVLVYPKSVDPADLEHCVVGSAAAFSSVKVGDVNIRAVNLGVCGISKRGGLKKFVTALSNVI